MQTKKLFSRLVTTGTRLLIFVSMLMTALISNVTTIAAAPALLPRVGSVTVAAQSGTLTTGTAGSVTYLLTVTKGDNNNLTAGLSVTAGLPLGATASFSPASLVFGSAAAGTQLTSTLTINTTDATPVGVTNFTVQAVRINGGNGSDLATGTGTLTIQALPQSISFAALADKVFGDPDFNVSATASSGLTVSFAATGNCTVAGTLVHLTGVGSCTITASQAGDASYLPATDVSQTFNIFAPTGVIDLYAVSGTATLPGQSVTVWGYNSTNNPVTQPGGPVLTVNEGDTVTIALHNQLGETTGLLFQGQAMIPDTTGVAPGATKYYSFTASQPGTYLYEAGLLPNTQHQVAMGLYGALVVNSATAGQAYSNASTAFNDEATLVLSEIDPVLNNAANPAAFDMRNYHPKYWLINGKPYPQTDPIATAAGHSVLLRYVNAGLQVHSMGALGVRQSVIAIDGNPLAHAYTVSAETIGPGRSVDTIASVPASAGDGSKFAVFEASFLQHNNSAAGFGGMLTFLTVSGTPPTGDTTGPATSAVSLTSTSVSATVSDAGRGDSNVTTAEFFIDSTGANGSGTSMTGAFGTVTVNVSGLIAPALSGSHTVYVHGQDSAGNWGAFQSAVIANDTAGPTTSALSLSPISSNGTVNVSLSGTADDTASGGSNIAAAEYTIDGGSAQFMTVSPSGAKIASLTATISAATVNALSAGTHVVSVRSQDSLGNWGAAVTINLIVDKTGPVTSNVTASPNPSNGLVGFNSSTPAVRVTASFADTTTKISIAEGFIDTVGADGTGFTLLPTDGVFNTLTETGYVDIPLTSIGALSDGNHTIYVHSKDAAGNWGATSMTILVVDKTGPTITNAALTPSTIAFGVVSVTLNVTATDAGTGLNNGGQYWIDGTGTPPANPTAFALPSVTINTSTLAAGTHIVYFRVQDVATNWSAVSSKTLYVVLAVDDARSITANNSVTQTSDANAAVGVLANDEPVGVVGRTAALASAPVRTSGNGAGTLTLSCPASLGTAAMPAIGGNTICTNGAYRVTLNGVGNNNNQRRTSKQGTYQFTYTETLNGVTSVATVTITVP